MGLQWPVIFGLLACLAYFRGHRPSILALWCVMLGIALGATTLGHLAFGTVTTTLSAIGQAVVGSLNSVAR